ncbi:hypothetical protein FNV43_RR00601 [Rhamnella rubrinervis]|uniref:Uncharacterized protein n=1 Tax=Rhamnella rubrinervis TaxID=2594499 RepID=A0A8K0HPW0_9ROSA|nr:hypothetical protein FNV43_RR00601 [Rhamnella rubrinervis]
MIISEHIRSLRTVVTDEEAEALREGVAILGKGKWSEIRKDDRFKDALKSYLSRFGRFRDPKLIRSFANRSKGVTDGQLIEQLDRWFMVRKFREDEVATAAKGKTKIIMSEDFTEDKATRRVHYPFLDLANVALKDFDLSTISAEKYELKGGESNVWQGIVRSRALLAEKLCFKIGNGTSINLWKDPLIPWVPEDNQGDKSCVCCNEDVESRFYLFKECNLAWTFRNALQSQGPLNLGGATCELLLEVEEFKGKEAESEEGSSSTATEIYKWKPPHKDWLKINVDAAFNQNNSAGAFIFITKMRLNAIRSRFLNSEWKLVWSLRETNSVADSLARFSLFNNVALSVDEFSLGDLSSFVLDKIVVEQLVLAT